MASALLIFGTLSGASVVAEAAEEDEEEEDEDEDEDEDEEADILPAAV